MFKEPIVVKKMLSKKMVILFLLVLFTSIAYYLLKNDTRAYLQIDTIHIPQITSNKTPDTLSLRFRNPENPKKTYPIAPLDMVQKEIVSGIQISPAIAGKWVWSDANSIQFTPKQDWPANQVFTVYIEQTIFDKKALSLKETKKAFTTPAFEAQIQQIKLVQDIAETRDHTIFATMIFTHPVDAKSLVENLKLYDKASSQEIPFTVSYEEDLKTAYLRSNTIEIKDNERYIHLDLKKGVKTILGNSNVQKPAETSVLIPDIYSFLKISMIDYSIVFNKEGNPEQIFHITFTDAINRAEFIKHMRMKFKVPNAKKNIPFNDMLIANNQHDSTSEYVRQLNMKERLADSTQEIPYNDIEIIENERDSSKDYFIKTQIPFNKELTITLAKGMQSVNGFVLRREVSESRRVPAYPRSLNIIGVGSLLALSGEKKLSFAVRGVSGLKVSIQKLMDEQINHLITQTYGNLTSPTFKSYQFNADNITEKALEKTIALAQAHPKDQNYASLDFSTYLQNQGSGIFFIKVKDWDFEHNRSTYNLSDSRMIVVTDMGIVVKKQSDNSREVFVTSIHSGTPIAKASVSVLGKNGQPIAKADTDNNGHVSFLNLSSYTQAQEPTVIVASKGKDVSFIPYNGFSRQINYSSFDVGGLVASSSVDESTLSAFAFSDRGIYRPGDTVHLATIIRQGNFHIARGLFVKAKIYDARDKLIMSQHVKLDESGFFAIDLATTPTSSTGEYTYHVYLTNESDDSRNETHLGNVNFSVEEFRADTMKIKTSIMPRTLVGWANPEGLKAEVTLSNLFGTAAQNRKVKARAEISPREFYFNEYADYSFKDPLVSPQKREPQTLNFNDMQTDKAGLANYDIKVPDFDSGAYELTFSAEGFEPDGGRSVHAKSSLLVSPLKQMIGTKADGGLTYLKKAQSRSVEYIAINQHLEKIPLEGLRLELILNKRISVLTKQKNGMYRYETVIKKENLRSEAFEIAIQGTKVTLDTSEGGSFTLNILDKDNMLLSSLDYDVVSSNNVTGALEKNAELTLKLNKSTYNEGEEIEMNIVAPYTGTGLITIENKEVVAYKWFKTTTKSTIQHISVPKGLEGNAYVNVTFVRSIDSKEIFTSPLSYAVEPFTINSSKRQIDIALSAPPLLKPGEVLNIVYKADKKSKIIIYAVDEGILQVAKYKLPQPLKHFLKKRALGVETFQILDLILPEYSRYVALSGIGGGMMAKAAALGANLNPFQRTLDAPAVYWSGIIDANESEQNVSFTVPDSFSGSLKIMAVAVSDEAMGSAQTQTTVRGPFVLSPNILTVAAPSDEFEVSVGVSNGIKGSGKDAEISISLALSPNLQVLGVNTQKVKIPEGDEAKATFRLKALDMLGEGKVTFTATLNNESLKRSATLSIRPAQPFRTSINAKYEKEKPLHEIKVERHLYQELSTQTLSASTSPFVLATGMTEYLASYPHGCTEQIISQVFPWVELSATQAFAELKQKSDKNAEAVIARLQSRQSGNGGFTLWPNASYENKFTSLYAMHFITEVKDEAPLVVIPQKLYEGGMDYLREVARTATSNLAEARQRALAIYLLIRNKEVATNYLVDLHDTLSKHNSDWEKDITSAYMAASYQMLQKSDVAYKLIKKFDAKYKAEHTDFQSDMTMNAQYVYLVSKHFPKNELQVETDIMPLLEPVMSGRLNTISSSYTILALSAYSQRNQQVFGNDDIEFVTIGASKIALPKSELKPFIKGSIPNGSSKVGIISKTPLFYQLVQSGFDKNASISSDAKGIEVYREYLDSNGTELKEFRQGDEVNVRLRVRSTDKAYISNVVLIDLLPGGFEVLRDSVPRDAPHWSADYVDIREDRVVYYASFSSTVTELFYKVKVTAAGKFIVPSTSAQSMYDPTIHAHTAASFINVKSAQ